MFERLTGRIRALGRLRSELGLWFHPGYGSVLRDGLFAPSSIEPRRGDLVVGRLVDEGLIRPNEVRRPELASLDDLASFHSWAYLDGVTAPEHIARVFGTVPGVLPAEDVAHAARLAVGGTVEAAHAVGEGRLRTAINLGGGFHHAEPEMGSGFCLYNDVGVAIRSLRRRGYDRPILIIDLDIHQGNGNSGAFEAHEGISIYSIHGSVWSRRLDRNDREIHLRSTVTDERYMAVLRTTLQRYIERVRPGLVFYICGADVLAGDRLGSFWLTVAGVFARDCFTTQLVRESGAGLVITLGGGYSRQAWLTHFNYARYLLCGATDLKVDEPSRRERFDRIARSLDPLELQGEEASLTMDLSQEELFGELAGEPPARRFLDYYSRTGIQVALERYGLLQKVRDRGYSDPRVEISLDDPRRHSMFVDAWADGAWHRVVELMVHRSPIYLVEDGPTYPVLWVEWMMLQDPVASFSLERPRLPGQTHPGLGLARDFLQLLFQICIRLDLAALVYRPAHYHNGVAATTDASFIVPEVEARVRALATVLAGIPVAEATWLVEQGYVVFDDGAPLLWKPSLQVVPRWSEIQDHFRSDQYRSEVMRHSSDYMSRGLHLKPGCDISKLQTAPLDEDTRPRSSPQLSSQ